MKEKIIQFLFPKNIIDKKFSLEIGFFGLMISYFAAGVILFFVLTGFRLKSVLTYPMFSVLIVMLTMGTFYLSYLTRKLAIRSREAVDYNDLRLIVLFFQKRVFQLCHFPLLLLGISIIKMNEMTLGLILIGFSLLIQIFMYLSEWKLIHKKLD